MTSLVVLVPGLIIGAIAWGAVGILRQRGREPFTLATATAFYAQVAMIAGILSVLSGLAVLAKLGLSLIDPAWAYYMPGKVYGSAPYAGPPGIPQQQGQDLILALMLLVIGATVAGGHWYLGRRLASLPGGSPSWLVGGSAIALTVLTGLAGALSLVVGGYAALSYFVVGVHEGQTFADPLGAALVFVPAWMVAITYMLRGVRRSQAPTVTRPLQPA